MFQLRPFQKEALLALERNAHVLCVAPTGSGKSLIYETIAGRRRHRIVLITPLLALARQQYRKLSEYDSHVALGAGQTEGPPSAKSGVWIISPEALVAERRQAQLQEWNPDFLVVDECHCLWDWGDGFRPAFLEIPKLLDRYGIKKSLWLTATLPRAAREELRGALPGGLVEIGEFALPRSLELSVLRVPWKDRSEALLAWLAANPEPGIVFVPTRGGTLRISRLVLATGRNALPYHAGMCREERLAVEAALTSTENSVVIATSAFGMGMDLPRLRWAALWQAPPSLLSLAQAVGRVARGAGKGRAVVLWEEDDFRLIEWMARESPRRRADLLTTYQYLRSNGCRSRGLEQYFNESTLHEPCERCDVCRRKNEVFDHAHHAPHIDAC